MRIISCARAGVNDRRESSFTEIVNAGLRDRGSSTQLRRHRMGRSKLSHAACIARVNTAGLLNIKQNLPNIGMWRKMTTFGMETTRIPKQENPTMRMAGAILGGTMAALTTLTAPAMAEGASRAEQSASSTCSSYQRNSEGLWVAIPCQEVGSKASPRQKTASQSSDDER